MLFEDQIEQLNDYVQSLSAKVQENATFNALQDRYRSLSPLFQKILITTACCFTFFLILADPIANYKTSLENMISFEDRKKITQKIIAFQKRSKSVVLKPKEYTLNTLQTKVRNLSRSYSINFLPEQISVVTTPVEKNIISGAKQNNFKIKINKATVNQFTALTYSLQKLNKSLLVDALELTANPENLLYFDGSIRIANLYVQPTSKILPKPTPVTKSKKSKRKRSGGK